MKTILLAVFLLLASATPVFAETLTIDFPTSTENKAGQWGVFAPGNNAAGQPNDFRWDASFAFTSQKSIKSITIYRELSNLTTPHVAEAWSTSTEPVFGRQPYPLVVFRKGTNTQLNTAYNQTIGPFGIGPLELSLYGQIEIPGFYKGVVTVQFTDGTSITAEVPGTASTGSAPNITNATPTFSTIPNHTIQSNSNGMELDLKNYANDAEDGKNLTFTAGVTDNTIIDCGISGSLLICRPPKKVGSTSVIVGATDSKNANASTNFSITVVQAQTPANTAPTISAIQNRTILQTEGAQIRFIDLWSFASDNQDSNDKLIFFVEQSDSSVIQCYLDTSTNPQRYISCNAPAKPGTTKIDVTVRDSGSLSAATSFNMTVQAVTNPSTNTPPNINGELISARNGNFPQTRVLDLWTYATDSQDSDDKLVFSKASETNTGLVSCSIQDFHFLHCGQVASGTGTAIVTIQVRDLAGGTDSAQFFVSLTNDGNPTNSNAPVFSSIPDRQMRENSGRNSSLVDLWNFVSDDRDTKEELDFRIVSESNTGLINCEMRDDRYIDCEAPREDRTGNSTITVEVEDTSNLTDRESFIIEVTDQDSGVCSDIRLVTRTVFMDESDTTTTSFEIENRSEDEFDITDFDVRESSQYLRIKNTFYDTPIGSDDSQDIEIELESTSVTTRREATVTIEIEGEFENGTRCDFSDITRTFRVEIENDGGSSNGSGVCRDITIEAPDITINENTVQTKTIKLTNESDRTFTVDSVRIEKNSGKYSAQLRSKPSSISRDSSANATIRIDSDSVSSTSKGKATIKVSGRFSNGSSCSISSISESFDVTVRDSSDSGDDDDSGSDSLDISFSPSAVTVREGQSSTVNVNLQNNLGDDYCFELSALGSGPFNSTLSTNSVCIQDNESANITLRINGNREGSSTLSFIATYGNRTVTKTLGVNVTADTTTTPPSSNRVEIRVVSKTPNISQSGIIALENTGDDLADVTITLTGLPATTRATTITKSLWQGGETVELEVKNQDFNGVANATIRISSDLGNKNIPVSLNFTNPSQGSPTGLANLITDAAFILGGLIVVILAIVGLISIFQPK